ncbi:MAG: SRPBCC family protein [Deltaproteobacteria bacterium]|nr:SRPBCC family protein [Deltaproteobacteria bacterium]
MRALTEQIGIQAPPLAVWAVLEDFGGVSEWAPYMRRSSLVGNQQSGVGASRFMRHAWGFSFEETVTEWTDGHGFSFEVHRAPFPMKDVHETWVTGQDNGLSTVTTSVTYGMQLGFLGSLVDWILVRFVVRREMRAGLLGLKRYVESKSELIPQES